LKGHLQRNQVRVIIEEYFILVATSCGRLKPGKDCRSGRSTIHPGGMRIGKHDPGLCKPVKVGCDRLVISQGIDPVVEVIQDKKDNVGLVSGTGLHADKYHCKQVQNQKFWLSEV
jgi:hypothetical protein